MIDSIRTGRLLLRRWRAEDAPALKEAIDVSLPELQAWVPWALGEPSPLAAIAERLQDMHAKFLAGEDWAFGVFDPNERRVLGGAGLHPRGRTDHLEIGYWIRTDASGRGYGPEAAAALRDAAFDGSGHDRLEIHCDAQNARSAGVARRLGFELTRSFLQEAPTARAAQRTTLVWTLTRESWLSTSVALRREREHEPGSENREV